MYLGALAATGTPPDVCRASGGIPVLRAYQVYDANRVGIPGTEIWECQMPTAAAPVASQPVTITVPTTVQTQVSPQVSPVFIQQSNPQNSPVGAATSQQMPTTQSATPQTSVGAPDSSFYEYLKQNEARAAEREQALFDLLAARNENVPTTEAPPALGPATMIPVDSGGDVSQASLAPVDHSLRNGLIVAAFGTLLAVAISKRNAKAKGR